MSQDVDSLNYRKTIIKSDLTSFVPDVLWLNYGCISLSIERNISEKISLCGDLGYIIDYGHSSEPLSISVNKISGFNTNIEMRYYFSKQNIIKPLILLFWPLLFQLNSYKGTSTGYYISGHIQYQRTLAERIETISKNIYPNTIYYQNQYDVIRSVYALHLKFGYQSIKKHGFTIDQAIGFGIRYIYSYSKNKMVISEDFEFPYNKPYDSGAKFFPSISYHFKIGIGLNLKHKN